MKLLIILVLFGFTACGVKAPPVPYLDVVAKEKAAEEDKARREALAASPSPTPTPEVRDLKKKTNKKKK